MSSVVISGDTSGTVTLAAPSVAGSNTITLPASTGNLLTDIGSSLSANGYVKLSNGLIIQWFTSGAGTTATFPVAFPNGFLNAVVQENYNGAGYNNNVVYISGSSTTGLTFAASSVSGRRIIAIGY